jgi:hypothetical protein
MSQIVSHFDLFMYLFYYVFIYNVCLDT